MKDKREDGSLGRFYIGPYANNVENNNEDVDNNSRNYTNTNIISNYFYYYC